VELNTSAWGQEIHAAGCCAVNNRDCSGPLEAHHILRRHRHATRNDPRGGILLCQYHHRGKQSAHHTPRWFMAWLAKNRPEQAAWVEANRWKINK